jgi:quercetin dioxygenase-like cupin family protein
MSFTSLRELEEREVFPGFRGRFVHTDNMTFVYWVIEAGAPLPPHSHPHEQVAHMFEGRFELTIGDTTRILEPGAVATIPSNIVHSGKALTQCRIMDAFCPVREDYR